jgi:3-deoxy-manno-octulosonate cytidylyltransferase (CMP-KDO synthetase)
MRDVAAAIGRFGLPRKMLSAVVLIPARMAAMRLPGKPLADIAGQPMIVQVLKRALAADVGPVFVATQDNAIADAVAAAGGKAIMTGDHENGTSRIHAALAKSGSDAEIVINLQGDLPDIEPATIRAVLDPLSESEVAISTAAAPARPEDRDNPNVVKIAASQIGARRLRCLYFSRATIPSGDGPVWHHIGLYAYRRAALDRYMRLPPSPLEIRERLEQLRALEAGMRIDAAVVDAVPISVDTPDDLERARRALSA